MHSPVSRLIIGLVPHIVALLLIAVCLKLSAWQDGRADGKAALITQWEQAPTITADATTDLATVPTFSRITLTGTFELEKHIFLDNKTRNNHPGVHVFVPLQHKDSQAIYLVNRGWQPWLRHANQWPEYPTPQGEVTITGRLSTPPSVGFQLGQALPLDVDLWPNLMTYLDMERIREALGPQVAERIILLDPDDALHLSGDPWPSVNMSPERHRAYAFQWLAIATAIFVLWVALSYRLYRKKS